MCNVVSRHSDREGPVGWQVEVLPDVRRVPMLDVPELSVRVVFSRLGTKACLRRGKPSLAAPPRKSASAT